MSYRQKKFEADWRFELDNEEELLASAWDMGVALSILSDELGGFLELTILSPKSGSEDHRNHIHCRVTGTKVHW